MHLFCSCYLSVLCLVIGYQLTVCVCVIGTSQDLNHTIHVSQLKQNSFFCSLLRCSRFTPSQLPKLNPTLSIINTRRFPLCRE